MNLFKIKTVVKTVCKGEAEPNCPKHVNEEDLRGAKTCPKCQGFTKKDEQLNIAAVAFYAVILGSAFAVLWLMKSIPISQQPTSPLSKKPISEPTPTPFEAPTPEPTSTPSEKPIPEATSTLSETPTPELLPTPSEISIPKPKSEKLPVIKSQSIIKSLEISLDGQTLIGATQDGKISVWDTKTGQVRFQLPGHNQPINAIATSANAQTIVSAGEDGTVKVWDLKLGTQPYNLIEENSSIKNNLQITSLAISEDGQTLVIGGQNNQVQVWNMTTKRPSEALKIETGVESLAISKDAQLIVSGNYRGKINIWKLNNGQYEPRTLEPAGKDPYSVAISSNGEKIVSSSCTEKIRVWNPNTLDSKVFTSELASDICLVAISNDAKMVAGLSTDKILTVWDLEADKVIYSFAIPKNNQQISKKDIRSIAFSGDGQTIAASFGQTIEVWRLPLQ